VAGWEGDVKFPRDVGENVRVFVDGREVTVVYFSSRTVDKTLHPSPDRARAYAEAIVRMLEDN
jgi:hypothetical protein